MSAVTWKQVERPSWIGSMWNHSLFAFVFCTWGEERERRPQTRARERERAMDNRQSMQAGTAQGAAASYSSSGFSPQRGYLRLVGDEGESRGGREGEYEPPHRWLLQ